MRKTVRDVVTITQASESDERGSTGDAAAKPAVAADDASSDPLLCWICRQPLAERECVRWRGEPVHYDCL